MPLGLSVGYRILGPLDVSARLSVDPLISGITALLGSPHWFWMEASARIDFRPLSWLLVWTEAAHRIESFGMGDRAGSSDHVMAGGADIYSM